MQSYHIHELERLTGIKAHTIRIWEKRYGLITPSRTTTNRRYYDDDQVKKLLNVTTLLAQGRKISKIAALSDDEINSVILAAGAGGALHDISTGFINDLLKSMLAYDETAFEKTFAAASIRYGIYSAMTNIVYPFLKKVGVLWNVNKTAPAQEHFATCIIKRKLMAAIDGLMPPTEKTKKFLLFLPENEWHEIGLLFANYLVRSKGFETIYLGQNVPFDNVQKVVEVMAPAYMLLFYVAARSKDEVEQQLKAYAGISGDVMVLAAGHPDLFLDKQPGMKNIKHLTDVHSLTEYL